MTNLKPSQNGQIRQTSGSSAHNPKLIKWMHILAGAFSLLGGMLVLLGWQFDIGLLKSLKPEWVSMKSNTAVCFMLVGLALIAVNGFASPISKWLPRICASLVGLVGLLSLGEYVLKLDFGIDQLLFIDSPNAVDTTYPGRMAPDTVVCFIALALVLWLMTARRTSKHLFALAILGSLVASFALAGILSFYTVSVSTSGWWSLTLMAMPTAMLFLLLGSVVALGSWWQSRTLGPLGGKAVAVSACWSILLVGSLAWNLMKEATYTLDAATVVVRTSIAKDICFRRWASSHGGVYVRPTEHTPPNPYLNVPERDVTTTTGQPLTLMNPAYMLREMETDFGDNYGVRTRIASLNPINPGNAADTWEVQALARFELGVQEVVESQLINGELYLRLMLPIVVEPGCLNCHSQQGYKLGDIRGGIDSSVTLAPYLARSHTRINALALTHGMVWLVGLAGLGFGYRREHFLSIDIATGFIIGAEALVRWQHPIRGLTPPNRFIPMAEETGLICLLGEWVLRETCRQGRQWIESGLPPLTLAVNISAHQMRYADIQATVSTVLAETGYPAERLELELTERSLMRHELESVAILQSLRDLGVFLSIDDFGTGYSSLAYLKLFPVDVLKIDKQFIDNLTSDQNDREITAAIIALTHALNLKVLAEGVETPEQLEFLRRQGCDRFQGYYHSRPLPADEFEQLFRQQAN